jgi:hypothetical protein
MTPDEGPRPDLASILLPGPPGQKREKMSDIGPPPELLWLPVKQLYVDHRYQRTLETPASKRLVAKIAENFSWLRFGAVLAVEGGADKAGQIRWKIIDGQHRTAAARQCGIESVPGLVHSDVSLADQALAFVGANKDRIAVSAQALYHAQLAAGDPSAVLIKNICDEAGIEFLRYSISLRYVPAGKTTAQSRLLRMLHQHGERITREGIAVVGACFGGIQGALRSIVFEAAIRFIAEGNCRKSLEYGLKRLGPDGIEKIAFGLGANVAIPLIVQALNESNPKRAAADDPEPKRDDAVAQSSPAARTSPGGSSEANTRQSGPAAGPALAFADVKTTKPAGDTGRAGGSPASTPIRLALDSPRPAVQPKAAASFNPLPPIKPINKPPTEKPIEIGVCVESSFEARMRELERNFDEATKR